MQNKAEIVNDKKKRLMSFSKKKSHLSIEDIKFFLDYNALILDDLEFPVPIDFPDLSDKYYTITDKVGIFTSEILFNGMADCVLAEAIESIIGLNGKNPKESNIKDRFPYSIHIKFKNNKELSSESFITVSGLSETNDSDSIRTSTLIKASRMISNEIQSASLGNKAEEIINNIVIASGNYTDSIEQAKILANYIIWMTLLEDDNEFNRFYKRYVKLFETISIDEEKENFTYLMIQAILTRREILINSTLKLIKEKV